MNPQEPLANSPGPHTIEAVSAGETKVGEVHKHPFGIILLYLQAGFGLAVAIGLMYFLLPQFVTDSNQDQLNTGMLLLTIIAVGITLLVLFIASVVYRQSYLIISDKNVTQVLQQSIFKRKVSELSMANIEDVTAEQRGIFATLFNFGKLTIETAGEQNNFIFNYCPKPNYCGKLVLDTRQRYLEAVPAQAQLANNRRP